MTDQIKEALVLLGYFVEEPESVTVAHEADKQYNELLAYVERVELAIEAGYQMCDGNEYEKFITVWTSCNYRPKWLPEQSEEE